MCNDDMIVLINGKCFRDVTNQTVAGSVYNYEEAVCLSKGERVSIYYGNSSENSDNKK